MSSRIRATIAGLLAALPLVGCSDSHFAANAEDRNRLAQLAADPVYTDVRKLAGDQVKLACTAAVAAYHHGTEPLDFSHVTDNQQTCYLSVAPTSIDATDVAMRIDRAVAQRAREAGWRPDGDQFTKTLNGQVATLRVLVLPGGATVEVRLALPHH